jgi:hypothetical protein
MRGNFQVRFLGEGAAAMPFPYPTLGMLHQFQALSSKAMLREAVNARTLRLNDITLLGEMAVTDVRERVIA